MIDIDKIYIIHYPDLVERKVYLDSNLPKFNIPYEYKCRIMRNSPEIEDPAFIDLSDNNRDKRNVIYHTKSYGGITDGVTRTSWKANLLEHYFIFNDFVNSNDENILVLEDDVIFGDGFFETLETFLHEIPDDYDIVYLGSGCDLKFPSHSDKLLEKHPERRSKCGDSYIVSNKAASKIVTSCLPLYCNWDWELNYQQEIHKMDVYWAINPMIFQGSEHGQYSSSC